MAATFRQQAQAEEFTKKAGRKGLRRGVPTLTNEAQVKTAVAAAIQAFGRLDVMVNNAGYGSMGSIEEVPAEEVQPPVRRERVRGAARAAGRAAAAAPAAQRATSSTSPASAGLKTFPGVGIYNASKFALEAIGESLAQQVKPLGIKVTNIEPSGFRTEWAGASATYVDTKIEDYRSTVGENLKGIQGYSGKQPGDPVRAARAMYDVVQQENPPLHLPLGKAAVKGAREKFEGLLQELGEVAAIGDGADYPPEEM